MRYDSPWPRQSCTSTAKPRAWSSPTTSKYFSIGSVRPGLTTTDPRARAVGWKRAARSRAPPAPANHSAPPPAGMGARGVAISGAASAISRRLRHFREQGLHLALKRHGQAHVGELKTAGHHRVHGVELALAEGHQVVHGDGQGQICLLYTSDAADDLLCVDLG